MRHPFPRLTAFLASMLCIAPALAEGLTIADLAPPDAVTVIGVDNCKTMFDSFDSTELAAIWKDPEFQKWFEKQSKETLDEMAKGFEELGVKMEDLKRPVGAAGIAAWFTGKMPEEPGAAAPPPAVLIMADYADQAEEMHTTLITALEKAQARKQAEYKEDEHDGVTIYTYKLIEPDQDAPEVVDDEGDPMDDMGPDGGWEYEEMHYARAGNILLVCSEMEFMEKSIDRLKGAKGSSIAENETFQRVRSQLGPNQAYTVMMADAGREWLKKEFARGEAEGDDPFPAMASVLMSTLGLEQLQGAGMGLTFESDAAITELSYAVLAPKKEGIIALFDTPEMPFNPPTFVGADTSSYTAVQVNFPGILPLAERVIRNLPEDTKAMVEGQFMMAQQMMGPMLANLGPEMHIINKYERPFSAESTKQVYAIKLRDQQAFTQALKGIVPMMGLEPREFNGNQIYSPGDGGMLPREAFSVGLGFGHAFMGPTTAVENLMRDAGAADAARLAGEAAFKKAQQLTTGKGIGYSYVKMSESIDWLEWYMKNYDKIIEAQITAMFGANPPADEDERQWRDQYLKDSKNNIPAMMKDPPPMHLFRKHIGDTVAEFRSTSEGFVGKYWMLPAE